jgi:hypothetical protein
MKVRLNNQKSIGAIARLEALLAGMILTVSTAYAATVCPLYWTQLQLEAQLHERLVADEPTCLAWPADLHELAESSGQKGGGAL